MEILEEMQLSTLILSEEVKSIEGMPVAAQTNRCDRKPAVLILSRPRAMLLKWALAMSNFPGHGIPLPFRNLVMRWRKFTGVSPS